MNTPVVRSLPEGMPQPSATFFDRALEVVAPRRAALRYQARLVSWMAGQYIGARTDRRQTQDWRPRVGSGNSDTLGDLDRRGGLRSRSADLERNDPIAKGAIASNITSILGPGLNPYPTLDATALGLSEEQADAWESNALRLWNAHCGSTDIDYSGQCSIDDLSRQVLWGQLTKGDILAVKRYVDRPSRILGLAVQLVEADRISNPQGQLRDTIMGGVEFDPVTCEVKAFHVASAHPDDNTRGPVTWSRVAHFAEDGTLQAQLVMDTDRPNLLRGVPYLAPVIEPLRQLSMYSDNELTAAVLASFFTVFVKRKSGALDANGLPVPNWQADNLTTSTANNPGSSAMDLKLGAGAILELEDDEDITIADPKRPNATFDPYFLAMVKRIGIALEIPFEVLIKHYSTSYTAARAAMIEFWRVVLTRRARLIRGWYQPTWRWFITECVAKGYLSAPGFFSDPLVRAAWCQCEWSGPTMPQVDETKAAEAMRARVALTVTTLEEETAAATGRPWSRKIGQIQKERRILEAAGIPTPQGAPSPTPAKPGQLDDPVNPEDQ